LKNEFPGVSDGLAILSTTSNKENRRLLVEMEPPPR